MKNFKVLNKTKLLKTDQNNGAFQRKKSIFMSSTTVTFHVTYINCIIKDFTVLLF